MSRLRSWTLPASPKPRMHMEFNAATDFTLLVWAATHPIARLADRLASLLLLAGGQPARRRALPASRPSALSGASNRGI
jgi:hypothetical protein